MTDFEDLRSYLKEKEVTLVAVSKTKPASEILSIYREGQLDFGENRVQELTEKQEELPKDIQWHLIGHLQRNKVKYIVPFVHLIHSVDSFRLLKQINKEAKKINRVVDGLLQVKIAKEDTKYGWDKQELIDKLNSTKGFQDYPYIRIRGLMGMATFTDDQTQVQHEFESLRDTFEVIQQDHLPNNSDFTEISMGMSGDYKLAVAAGSTMVRIGSLIFGPR